LVNIVHFCHLSNNSLEAEVKRQIDTLESGELVTRETRGYDPKGKCTFSLRSKGVSIDYRYIRDYDLPELVINNELVDSVQKGMPKTKEQKYLELMKHYGLDTGQIDVLMGETGLLALFEKLSEANVPRLVFNW